MRTIAIIDGQHIELASQEEPACGQREQIKARLEQLWRLMRRDDLPVNHQASEVKRMIQAQNWAEARRELANYDGPDAEMLNLSGAFQEMHGDFSAAERCYRAAFKRDPSLGAAEFNLRRCYELWTFGRSEIPICL